MAIDIDSLIDEVYNKSIDNTLYEDFLNLDTNNQVLLIKTMLLAFKSLIVDLVSNKLPIHLPYIGTLKIKDGNKIALKNMKIVAKQFNCKSYSEIPDTSLEEAKVILFKLNMQDKKILKDSIEKQKLIDKENKKKHIQKSKSPRTNTKILTFNINNIKKT